MRLSKIRIQNFRNFRDTTIDPFPTPAVILGENGVGKSNLLHALRLVLDPITAATLSNMATDVMLTSDTRQWVAEAPLITRRCPKVTQ
ncbi:AAA family ATPase [Kitasatospora sp. NPDC088779]|uniref:AAA family ATPase n=1 Tax=unclassified Kitasatospora TaxID=2633591 RepID=UPI00343DA539